MAAYVEVWSAEGPELVPLEGDRITVGKVASNEIAITGDGQVSRVHAALGLRRVPLPS